MTERSNSLAALMWRMKWWWMVPMGVIAVLFVLLVLFSNASGDSPFTYALF